MEGAKMIQTVEVPVEIFKEMLDATAAIKAIKAYTLSSSYSVDRETIAELAGFELPGDDSNA